MKNVVKNVVALDQENGVIVAVVNGDKSTIFDPKHFSLPNGGGVVVADGNVWKERNSTSTSQYCWKTKEDRKAFLELLEQSGYRAIQVSNKLASDVMYMYPQYEMKSEHAVAALYDYVREQTNKTGRFDSGHPVRESRGDISHGERAIATNLFLRLQNEYEYNTPFIEDVIRIAYSALNRNDRSLFDLKKTKVKVGSPRRLAAVAVCVWDENGSLRMYKGKPWGIGFITRRIIGLSGVMRGTGDTAPGNPMRAALRFIGGRSRKKNKVNPEQRSRLDKCVRILIRAFDKNGAITPLTHPVRTEDSILPAIMVGKSFAKAA